jgi:hypothetical protein
MNYYIIQLLYNYNKIIFSLFLNAVLSNEIIIAI